MTALTPTFVLTAFIVFCRIGGCLLVIPGFSSPRLTTRARLFTAIAICLALTPYLSAQVTPAVEKAAPIGILQLILSESLKGVLIGLLGRFFFLALETMAGAISFSIGMSSPMGPPIDGDEEISPIASLISVSAVVLIFVTNLHFEVFRGLAASYDVLPVNQWFEPRQGLVQLTDQATKTFLFTLRIAAPFMAFSIIANLALGLVNKLVPQIPVSFLAAPFLLAGGFLIFYVIGRPALDLFVSGFAGWAHSG